MELFSISDLDYYRWPIILVSVVAIGTVLFLRYLSRNDDYWEKRGVPYFPRQSFISLLLILSSENLNEFQIKIYKKFKRFYGGFQFSSPAMIISDPDLLKDILVKDFHVFSHRRDVTLNNTLMDNMVTVLKGEDWRRVRTIITPAFTSNKMRKMGNIINECSKTVLKTFDKHFQKGEPVDCKAIFGAFTIDVIGSAAFAMKIDFLNDPKNMFVQMSKKIVESLTIKRLLLLNLLPQKLLNLLGIGKTEALTFFKSVILQTIKERRESGKTYNDLLQTLTEAVEEENCKKVLDNPEEDLEDVTDQFGSITSTNMSSPTKYKKLSEDELIAQCVLFFFVGYETTASVLTFMAYALASNEDWQDKLLAEVDECFKKHSEMSYDTVRDMIILDAVVSETLRMYPPLLGSERTTTEDYELGDTGIIIEKGIVVGFPIYAMHYDPDFFSDPEVFNPERFMNSDKYSHPRYAYLPFGAGPRNCLGMRFALLEIKLCMVNILHHYRFQICSSTKVPLQYRNLATFLTVNELPLAIEKRKHL